MGQAKHLEGLSPGRLVQGWGWGAGGGKGGDLYAGLGLRACLVLIFLGGFKAYASGIK